MTTNITPTQISERLNAQVDDIVKELLPNGKKQGHEWCVGSVHGEAGESLKVHLTGDKAGVCADFATGWTGDLLDLYCETQQRGLRDAIDWACKRLGIERTRLHNGAERTYKPADKPADLRTLENANPVKSWLESRGIREGVANKYKVVAKGNDTVAFPFLRDGKLVHVQYRTIAEKRFFASEGTELTLFGWDAIDPRTREVVICEGPIDALSWAEYGFDAMSVPNGGGGNGKQGWIERDFDRMARFDKIYVSMDADGPGLEAAAAICERLGRHRCFVIKLPDGYKDINDCLMAGVATEIIEQRVEDAQTMDPEELRNAICFAQDVVEFFHPSSPKAKGIISPWEGHINEFQFDYGATTVLAGWNGSGKSTAIGQIVLEAGLQGVKCCVASLEFRVPRYIGWLVRQGLACHLPDVDAVQYAVEKLGKTLWAFAAYGEAKIDKIVAVWEYAHARYGCRLFILDNLSKIEMKGDDENRAQKEAMALMTEFAVRTNSHVIVAAHSRKGMSEHEEVGKLDIKGSGAITDLADAVLIIHRNKKKEKALRDPNYMAALEPEESSRIESAPDSYLTCSKNRHGETEPRIALWWNHEAHQYVERDKGLPRKYLK